MLERGNMTDAEYIAALQKELMVQTNDYSASRKTSIRNKENGSTQQGTH